jgi:hypothetical protein
MATPAEVRAATLEAFLAALDAWLTDPLASYSPAALRAEAHRRIQQVLNADETRVQARAVPVEPTFAESQRYYNAGWAAGRRAATDDIEASVLALPNEDRDGYEERWVKRSGVTGIIEIVRAEARAVPVEGDRERLAALLNAELDIVGSDWAVDYQATADALLRAGVSLTGSGLREALEKFVTGEGAMATDPDGTCDICKAEGVDYEARHIGEAAAMRTVLGHLLNPRGRIHDSGCGTCDAGRALLNSDHELPSLTPGALPDHPEEPSMLDLTAVDRLLAVAHREDDQPCNCDECMAYGGDDNGVDWYRVPVANRIAIRILDGADDRFEPLVTAFRAHAAALSGESGEPRVGRRLRRDDRGVAYLSGESGEPKP